MKQNIKRFLAITCLILSLFAVTITGYATTGTDNESTSSAQTSGRIIGISSQYFFNNLHGRYYIYFGRPTCVSCVEFASYLEKYLDESGWVVYYFDTEYWKDNPRYDLILEKYQVTTVPLLVETMDGEFRSYYEFDPDASDAEIASQLDNFFAKRGSPLFPVTTQKNFPLQFHDYLLAFTFFIMVCTHYYQLIRSNLKSFINGKLISSLLSSILIVLSSTFIYTLTMILTGHPIGDGRFSYEGTNLLLLKHLVENNHYWLHYMCHILVFSVIATLSPWISLIASTFTKNRYIIFLAPFVVIRFLDVFGDLTGYFWIKPSHYRLSGTNIYELGMLGTFLYAFCFLAICQLIYRYCIRRKLRNG